MISFFKEMISGGSKASLMRFKTLFITFNAMGVLWYQVITYSGNDTIDWAWIISLVSIALTGKVVQKQIEKTNEA